MGAETISTHTVNDVTTTVVTRTTTIISEHDQVIAADHHHHSDGGSGVVQGVKKTLRDYWFPAHEEEDEEESHDSSAHHDHHATHTDDPSLFGSNSVMRRAYDYWKSLTKDADESAKELVTKAKQARDEAAAEAKWAMFGYKQEAKEALERAEVKYREALAAAEKVHEEAQEKARSRWFQQADCTQKEVGGGESDKDGGGGVGAVGKGLEKVEEVTHKKWDRFKAAVDSLAFNPPKYACSPTSQYWFSRQNPSADSGWDCREIWDHPSRKDHAHLNLKSLPKKQVAVDKVHTTLAGLLAQAGLKAKNAPSSTGGFESSLKSIRDHYHALLDKVGRTGAEDPKVVQELDSFVEKIKGKLNEAKYHEEQTDSWLTSQWNAVVDNAGDVKDSYNKAFQKAVKNIQHSRTEAYHGLTNNLLKSVNLARDNIKEAIRTTAKDANADKTKIQKAIQEASNGFTNTLKEAEAKIKAAPKNAYENAVEAFNKETEQFKTRLDHLASEAKKSGASISHQASKSVSSVVKKAGKTHDLLENKAQKKLSEAKHKASSKYASATDNARQGYEQVTASASSIWAGAATPFSGGMEGLSNKVQEGYQKVLGDANTHWFGGHHGHHHGIGSGHGEHGHHHGHANSLYGALLALYLLNLARNIWIRRQHHGHGHGHGHHEGSGRRHSHSSGSSDDHHHHEHGHSKHGKHRYHEEDEGSSSLRHRRHSHSHNESHHHEDHTHSSHHHHGHGHGHHHSNSFGSILTRFTAILPVTLFLLVLLDLAGFNRFGLHTLFGGLVLSQVLQRRGGSYLNRVLEQLGIVSDDDDEVEEGGEGGVVEGAREMGQVLGWVVFGLAGAANAVRVLHGCQHH